MKYTYTFIFKNICIREPYHNILYIKTNNIEDLSYILIQKWVTYPFFSYIDISIFHGSLFMIYILLIRGYAAVHGLTPPIIFYEIFVCIGEPSYSSTSIILIFDYLIFCWFSFYDIYSVDPRLRRGVQTNTSNNIQWNFSLYRRTWLFIHKYNSLYLII